MVRLAVSVEGTTEEKFVTQVLMPYLIPHNIYITPISLKGNVSIDRIANEINKLAHNYDYVTSLYDFYGFKRKELNETKQSLESRIKTSLNPGIAHKVIPYVQMYEFEGILFSCPRTLSYELLDEDLEEWANKILKEFNNNPETINNSPQTAPSKRLEKDTDYSKVIDGPNIAEAIGVNKLREMCSGFDTWIASLENIKA